MTRPQRAGAYPRSRGETRNNIHTLLSKAGLSPLTRGNLPLPASGTQKQGPIPAHAGEPIRTSRILWCSWAYPRSRGGTVGQAGERHLEQGLSPLTRGNPQRHDRLQVVYGPIPAHAGEPSRRPRQCGQLWAYPRSRGGTGVDHDETPTGGGLSPLTRGNPTVFYLGIRTCGPIPAHAGEPCRRCRCRHSWRAYPRSRGGTVSPTQSLRRIVGLSPLTRGNPAGPSTTPDVKGPIPAHAGEPCRSRRQKRPSGAYPRSRGGTESHTPLMPSGYGLSPLTRGNRTTYWRSVCPYGPIPAHAGEPIQTLACRVPIWAYPRSRGGTPPAAVEP